MQNLKFMRFCADFFGMLLAENQYQEPFALAIVLLHAVKSILQGIFFCIA